MMKLKYEEKEEYLFELLLGSKKELKEARPELEYPTYGDVSYIPHESSEVSVFSNILNLKRITALVYGKAVFG